MSIKTGKFLLSGLSQSTLSELRMQNPNTKLWITTINPNISIEKLTTQQLEDELYARKRYIQLKEEIDQFLEDKMLEANQLGLHMEYQLGKYEDFLK